MRDLDARLREAERLLKAAMAAPAGERTRLVALAESALHDLAAALGDLAATDGGGDGPSQPELSPPPGR